MGDEIDKLANDIAELVNRKNRKDHQNRDNKRFVLKDECHCFVDGNWF